MRIATFNVENLDEESSPALSERIAILRPQLLRLNAGVLCLQEVHGQERAGQPRSLLALHALIEGTPYQGFNITYTETSADQAYDKRNLVILSRHPILDSRQIRNEYVDELMYRRITASPHEAEAKEVHWERPLLYAKIGHPQGEIHLITIHLKSRLPSAVPGQKEGYAYRTVAGWAEGYFISSMKRVGQALEARMLVDEIFDADPEARIIVCGDFNAEPGQVPVEAIAGRVENTGNPALAQRQLVPCSNSIAKESRYSHLHEGQGNLLDHMLISRSLLANYQSAEIHNEVLHDESIAFATDKKYPESDHAPFVVEFSL
jgi:endonuclease/exonuclease/phosphatase family metal-dependent hydrolase